MGDRAERSVSRGKEEKQNGTGKVEKQNGVSRGNEEMQNGAGKGEKQNGMSRGNKEKQNDAVKGEKHNSVRNGNRDKQNRAETENRVLGTGEDVMETGNGEKQNGAKTKNKIHEQNCSKEEQNENVKKLNEWKQKQEGVGAEKQHVFENERTGHILDTETDSTDSELGDRELLLTDNVPAAKEQSMSVGDKMWSCLARQNWRNIAALVFLWIAYVICTAAFSLMGPFFPEEALDKGASSAITGVIIGAAPFTVAVLSPMLGYLLPRTGTASYILVVLGGAYILLGFVTLLPSSWMFIVVCILLRITEGAGTAMFYTALFSTLPKLYPDSVSILMGVFQLAAGLGFSFGRPLGGILYHFGGYRLPFIFIGVSAIVIAIPCTLLNRQKHMEKPKNSLPGMVILNITTDLLFIVLALAIVIAFIAVSNQGSVLQPFLFAKFQTDPIQVSMVFFVYSLSYSVGNILCGVVSSKMSGIIVSVFGLVIAAIGEIILGVEDYIYIWNMWIILCGLILTGFGGAFAAVPIYKQLITVSERYVCEGGAALTSFVSGIVSASVTLGQFFGPVLSGVISDFTTFPVTSLIIGIIILAEGLLLSGVYIVDKYTWGK